MLHGEAIAIGMIMEAYISVQLLSMPQQECDEIKAVFDAIYPKIVFDKGDFEAIVKMLIYDKKNSHGKVKFALLEAIGNPKWDIEVPNALLKDAFSYYQKD